jgi:hypothetical protein
MGLTRQNLQGMVVITSFLLLVMSLLALIGWLQTTGYEDANRKHCSQYEIYPEKHLDKIPPGCQPQWFEVNQK